MTKSSEISNNNKTDSILNNKIASIPTNPGIYQFKNANNKIIYIGKAKNLRNRVRSYFKKGRLVDAKTKVLITKIADIEVILVDSEAEALILEDTLIKKHKPRYNVLLRDDKSYPYVRITNEDYPRIFKTRKIIRDGSKYFGPYTEVRQLRQLMKTLRAMYFLRSCKHNLTDKAVRAKKYDLCLDYHIKKCEGPCHGLISKEKYRENIKQAVQILNGKTKALEKILEKQMEQLSEEMKYEEAAIIRNRLAALKEYTSKQKIVTTDLIDRDVFGLARYEKAACTLIFKIREGKLIGKRHFIINNAIDKSDENIIQRTIERWYLESDFIPKEIFLPNEPDQLEYLLDWLVKKRCKSINLHIPKIGDKKKLVNLAKINAEFILKEYFLAIEKREKLLPRAITSLQRDLRLEKPPLRIECFDNSHLQGSDFVASLVVFIEGKPKKSEYRKFKIKTVQKNDDYAAMKEAVKRRYTRLINENAKLPDLIVIDGGKGQLSAAYKVLKELKIEDKTTIIGLAKRLEEIFFPMQKDSLQLPKTSSSLRIIQQLREEAHRFAIAYHRQLRSKRTLQTELTKINGVGEKTAKKLLIEFGSVDNIKKASEVELNKCVNSKVAKGVVEYYNTKQ